MLHGNHFPADQGHRSNEQIRECCNPSRLMHSKGRKQNITGRKGPEHSSQSIQTIQDPKALMALTQSVDFSTLPEKDLLEVYYVMGPVTFTDIMRFMLAKRLGTADDIKTFVSHALIRHELLVAVNLPPKY